MADVLFFDAGFSATSVEVRAISDAGAAFFAERIGRGAVGANLAKSGGILFLAACKVAGLAVEFTDSSAVLAEGGAAAQDRREAARQAREVAAMRRQG